MNKMDVITIFRNLVTNTYMADFDYMDYDLSFQTVFYQSGCSYCCCSCGFEHEYLDYISGAGVINEQIYEKIVKCLVEGKCPHVDKVPKEYVKTAGLKAIHIAAAVGTHQILPDRYDQRPSKGKLFGLTLYYISIIKNNHFITKMEVNRMFPYASRTQEQYERCKISLEFITLSEMCVKSGHPKLMQQYFELHDINSTCEILQLLMKLNDEESERMQGVVLQNKDIFQKSTNLPFTVRCCQLAIVYNKTSILDVLLGYLHPARLITHQLKDILNRYCCVLPREECSNILMKYGISTQDNIALTDQVESLFELFEYAHLRNTIIAAFNKIPNLPDILNEIEFVDESFLIRLLKNCMEHNEFPAVLKTLFHFGADINYQTECSGMTLLTYLIYFPIDNIERIRKVRQAIELMIFENPDVEIHETSMSDSLQQDRYMNTEKNNFENIIDFSDGFHMNAEEHGLFGHDKNSFALNFFLPLLLECGFPVSGDYDDQSESEKELIHHAEHIYVQCYFESPRSLLLNCRNSLRKHFKGRTLHTFLAHLDIPDKLKDYILLKPILKYAYLD